MLRPGIVGCRPNGGIKPCGLKNSEFAAAAAAAVAFVNGLDELLVDCCCVSGSLFSGVLFRCGLSGFMVDAFVAGGLLSNEPGNGGKRFKADEFVNVVIAGWCSPIEDEAVVVFMLFKPGKRLFMFFSMSGFVGKAPGNGN